MLLQYDQRLARAIEAASEFGSHWIPGEGDGTTHTVAEFIPANADAEHRNSESWEHTKEMSLIFNRFRRRGCPERLQVLFTRESRRSLALTTEMRATASPFKIDDDQESFTGSRMHRNTDGLHQAEGFSCC
jgi:hypothetical protein